MSKDEAEVRQSDEALISYPTYVLYNLFVLTTYGFFFFFFYCGVSRGSRAMFGSVTITRI